MAASIYMERDDVVRLTGKVQFAAQRRALERMRVKYTRADTGEPLVRLDRQVTAPVKGDRNINWDAIDAKS